MALNGSVSVEATRSGNDDLVFSWEAAQDQNTMTSTVRWKMELVAHAYGRIDQGTPQPWTVTIDGQEFSGTASVNIANNETKELASGQVVLTHNEDGTRSFAFTFSQELNITWGASSGNPIYIGAVTGEGSGELDPLEAPEPKPEKFPIKKWLAGLIAALCSTRRAFPQPEREPIGYFYGYVAKEGETVTHIVNGVDYVGAVLAKLPEWDRVKYRYAMIAQSDNDVWFRLFVSTGPFSVSTIDAGEFVTLRVTESPGFLWHLYTEDIYGVAPALNEWFGKGEFAYDYIKVRTVWSNYDILNTDGSVYLAASEPIPIYGEPVAYSYNGVRLQKLPEYPEEAYKHKFIKCQGNSIRAYVTDVELKFRINNSGAEMLVWEMNDSGAYKTFKEIYAQLKTSQGIVDAPEWRNLGSTTYISHFDSLLWSNYDILDESRTLILEASDPIPIYE